GPAGLAAAWEARRHNLSCEVLEKDHCVGGLSRTVNYKGYRFDIGGHRFFTKNIEVNAFWQEILKDDFISVNRLSRIYYNNRFFYYPLKPMNAFLGLGPIASVQILLSYVKARMAPLPEENTFEQWVTNRFGRKLYETFFKTYTEKVWGIPCSQIGAEWAAQRIKGLSLTSAVKNALFGSRGNRVKTLISTFQYPKEGPGMMYSAASDSIRSSGGDVSLNSEVMAIHHAEGRIREITVRDPESGRTRRLGGDQFLSSMPITHLVERLVPAPPDPVLRAAHSLKYRALLVVNLVLRRKNLFPDNWVYVHSPQVRLGRLQNYKNWSPWMIDNQEHTSLGLEYFCNEGDDLWTMPNEQLIELGGREIQTLGLARVSDVMDGFVYRAPFTYCVYDTGYEQHMKIVREYLARFPNLHPIGRAGMFKYNNMDHSILTGFLAVRNIMGARHDLWSVNADQDYHEEDRGSET
ncbi:MAG TPA: NAD(P)/FAD-dependent oxidoreductase, partial [Candidatus Sumerlaeota bacterium]|nr:NAD(P)/FAD-dependent oxidoreductase [Candidatus Sumerlaeota bacterium]